MNGEAREPGDTTAQAVSGRIGNDAGRRSGVRPGTVILARGAASRAVGLPAQAPRMAESLANGRLDEYFVGEPVRAICPMSRVNPRFTVEWPNAVRVTALVAVIFLSSYAIVRWVGGPAASPRPSGMAPVPIRPPGAGDSLNRGVWIEGGTFLMGNAEAAEVEVDPASPFSTANERPAHRETVSGFWMQEHEVTNEEYRRFDAGHVFSSGLERHPVVNVTWREAMDYAVSIGGTLPTEVQWEFAARGTESRKYPWGDSRPSCRLAQYSGCTPGGTIEVMARPDGATPERVYDLAGNVSEWVVPRWFDPSRYPVNNASRLLRGGSFANEAFFLRASNRSSGFYAAFKYNDIGFRVVWPRTHEQN